MYRSYVELQWVKRIFAAGFLSVALAGCGGGGDGGGGGIGTPIGGGGTPLPSGPSSSTPYAKPLATVLTLTIESITFPTTGNIYPVVNFKVTNEKNESFTGLNGTKIDGTLQDDLRFNIAKLTPGAGGPSKWQNYVNAARQNAVTAVYAVVGSTEKPQVYVRADEHSTDAGKPGVLIDFGNGHYSYTYSTNINDPAATCPPPLTIPCKDADGNSLDLVYNSSLTHRIAIYTRAPLPAVNAIQDIKPSTGATTGLTSREIVATAKCNECHSKLRVHDQGARIDTRLCVTCHNPGSWVANDDGTKTTVDFKVYIHKIHRGSSLPSVLGSVPGSVPKPYMIGTDNFSDVTFPQEIRNCTKCHDGSATNFDGTPNLNKTLDGDNWKTGLSRAACGSCHDNINFLVSGQATYTSTVLAKRSGHSGGVMTDDSTCGSCHTVGSTYGRSVALIHNNSEAGVFAVREGRAKFQFKIIAICGVAVNTTPGPQCRAGIDTPTVQFAVIDPTAGGAAHGYSTSSYGNAYKLFSDPEFWDSVGNKAAGSMSVDIAWDTRDYNNTGGFNSRPSRADQVNVFGAAAQTTASYGQSTKLPLYSKAVDNLDGSYTVTSLGKIPAGAVGSGVVAIEGRALGAPLTTIPVTTAGVRLPIKGEVAYFRIDDATPVARRVAVDAMTKCDNCHDQLSLHGGNRNDNVQLCVICHNPNNTDAQASARSGYNPTATPPLLNGFANGLPDKTKSIDGKKEESVDFKRMIHGIHAGAATSLDGLTALNGFRTKGIAVSGTDFSDVRFPGILNDCSTCHVSNTDVDGTYGTYELTRLWAAPTQNHILASTVDSTPGLTASNTSTEVNNSLQDPGDDYNISPTAAVCSSCHDGDLQKAHMQQNGAVFSDNTSSSTQANITVNAGTQSGESCPLCHGPGEIKDVKVAHNVP